MDIPALAEIRPPELHTFDGQSGSSSFFSTRLLGAYNLEEWVWGLELGDSDLDACLVTDARGVKRILSADTPVMGPLKSPIRFETLYNIPVSQQGDQYRFIGSSVGIPCRLGVLVHFQPPFDFLKTRPPRILFAPEGVETTAALAVTDTSYTYATTQMYLFPMFGRRRATWWIHNKTGGQTVTFKLVERKFASMTITDYEEYAFSAATDIAVAAGASCGVTLENEGCDFIAPYLKVASGTANVRMRLRANDR